MCETMAIPFNLPSDEQTEDNYRRLDQLLVDLYSVLRQILSRPRCVPVSTRDDSREPAPGGSRPANDVTGSRRGDLPDVVSSALSAPAPCQCPCRRRSQRRQNNQRRRSTTPNSNCCPDTTGHRGSLRVHRPLDTSRGDDNWLFAGEQLRKIAEELRTTFIRKQEVEKQEEDLKMEVKTSSLLSLLVPGQLRSSIWTTVILLVGWRLLVRSR